MKLVLMSLAVVHFGALANADLAPESIGYGYRPVYGIGYGIGYKRFGGFGYGYGRKKMTADPEPVAEASADPEPSYGFRGGYGRFRGSFCGYGGFGGGYGGFGGYRYGK